MIRIKILIIIFGFGYSLYMGSILFDALYTIQSKNLQTLTELQNEN